MKITDRAWRRLRARVLLRDGYRCAECGRPGDSVDHIKPRSEGGTNDLANLRVLCRSCNSSLGARLVNRRKTPARTGPRRVWPGAIPFDP